MNRSPTSPPLLMFTVVALCLSCGGGGNGDGAGGAGGAAGSTTSASGGTGGGAGGPSQSSVDHDTFGSGKRLRARYVHADGGADRFRMFHDTMLDLDCDFAPMTDGTVRCIPYAHGVSPYFADAGCSHALASIEADGCIESAPYAVKTSPPVCAYATFNNSYSPSTVDAVVALGAPVASTAQVYAIDATSGACTPTAQPSGSKLRALGDETPIDTFVGAKAVHELHDGRAQATRYEATDGSFRYTYDPHDTMLDVDCDSSGDMCLPVFNAGPFFSYADAACTERVAQQIAVNPPAMCPAPVVIFDSQSHGGCSQSTPIYEQPGAEVTMTWESTPGGCMPAQTAPNLRYFKVGAPLPASTLFRTMTKKVGSGRLRADRHVSLDGGLLALFDEDWTDTTLGGGCGEIVDDGGKGYCLPDSVAVSLPYYYADPACTAPIEMAIVDMCSTASPYPKYVITRSMPSTDGCLVGESAEQFSSLNEAVPFTGTTVYDKQPDGTCLSLPFSAPMDEVFFKHGASVPFSKLGRLQDVTD